MRFLPKLLGDPSKLRGPQLASLLVVAVLSLGCQSSASSQSAVPPAESACADFAALRGTLRQLPVRDIASGPPEALSQAMAIAIEEANGLKASAGGTIAPDVAALIVALEAARLTIESSSPQPIMSDGVLSDAAASLNTIADAWSKVQRAMISVCPTG
jgi:hypothetical protein